MNSLSSVLAAALRPRLPSAGSVLLGPAFRMASTSKREFLQKINEQHLAAELKSIASAGHTGTSPDPSLFKTKSKRPEVFSGPNWRGHPEPGSSPPSFDPDMGRFQSFKAKPRPWLHYESLRGETYPSGGTGPKHQDLTHAEAQRLQEMYMRKRMHQRKLLWLKQQELPNPEKEAKMLFRRQERQKEEEKAAAGGGDLYPPAFLDVHPGNRKLVKMEEGARIDELESRFRARIRQQKLDNARILKDNVPRVGNLVLDPIKKHVRKRLLRQRALITKGLEEFLTKNTAQILYEHLGGVQVSISRIWGERPKSTQNIYYHLLSDHDPEWVRRQLNIATPKIRSQFALKVNMGMTPNFRFVPHPFSKEVKRAHLWPRARAIIQETPLGGGHGSDIPKTLPS